MEAVVIPEGSAIVPPEDAAPTELSERRSTTSIAILKVPPGKPAMARTAADGHSGADPPRVLMKQDSVSPSEKSLLPTSYNWGSGAAMVFSRHHSRRHTQGIVTLGPRLYGANPECQYPESTTKMVKRLWALVIHIIVRPLGPPFP